MNALIRAVVAPAAIVVAAAAIAPSAGAAVVTQTVQGRYVRIESRADWSAAATMGPQTDVRWDLVVSARPPEPGTVLLGVSATGDVPVLADARLCAVAWQGAICPEGERSLRADWVIPRDGGTVQLEAMPADAVAHLRLDVRLAEGATAGGSTGVLVHAQGFGDSVQTGPSVQLPATGAAVPVVAVVGGILLVAVAAVLLIVGRRRRGGG